MLDPQIVVNLFLELGVGPDLVRHANLLLWASLIPRREESNLAVFVY